MSANVWHCSRPADGDLHEVNLDCLWCCRPAPVSVVAWAPGLCVLRVVRHLWTLDAIQALLVHVLCHWFQGSICFLFYLFAHLLFSIVSYSERIRLLCLWCPMYVVVGGLPHTQCMSQWKMWEGAEESRLWNRFCCTQIKLAVRCGWSSRKCVSFTFAFNTEANLKVCIYVFDVMFFSRATWNRCSKSGCVWPLPNCALSVPCAWFPGSFLTACIMLAGSSCRVGWDREIFFYFFTSLYPVLSFGFVHEFQFPHFNLLRLQLQAASLFSIQVLNCHWVDVDCILSGCQLTFLQLLMFHLFFLLRVFSRVRRT